MKITFNQLKKYLCESVDYDTYEDLLCEFFDVDDISKITPWMYKKALQDYEYNNLNEHDSSLLEDATLLVHEAAKQHGYNIIAHHGTTKKFSEFKYGDIGFHFGTLEQAHQAGKSHTMPFGDDDIIYLNIALSLHNPLVINNDPESWMASDLFYAAKKKIDSYIQNFSYLIDKDKILEAAKEKIDDNIANKRLNLNDQTNTGSKEVSFLILYQLLNFNIEDILKYGELAEHDENTMKKILVDRIKSLGYDGIKYLNLFEIDHDSDEREYSYIVLDANQIKNCEVISFKNGKIVPLEDRFNKNTNNLYEGK